MLDSLFKLFCITTPSQPSDINQKDHLILKSFINSFDDEKMTQKWMKTKNIQILNAPDLFDITLRIIRDILYLINSDYNSNIKSLFMKTDLSPEKINFPFYELPNIIKSVKRICKLNDKQNLTFNCSNDANFLEEIIFNELDMVFNSIEKTLKAFRHDIETTVQFMHFCGLIGESVNQIVNPLQVKRLLNTYIDIIKISKDMVDLILPDTTIKTFIKANYKGFTDTKKCFETETNFYIREKNVSVYPDNVLHYLMECCCLTINFVASDMESFFDKVFLCNKTTAEVLVTFFHYYSEIKGKNTIYEIVRQGMNEYKITWFSENKPSTEEIKNYLLKQEIPNLSEQKIIPKFGFIVNYRIEYSTVKSKETKNKPIKTRLILLSCGHQLGLELIDEFLENYYIKYSEPLMCHICRVEISIIGSYETIVYRCE